MKTKPILFNNLMVQALIAGTKTQTRRLTGLDKINEGPDKWVLTATLLDVSSKNPALHCVFNHTEKQERTTVKCPYGREGDILWVRERLYCDTLGSAMYFADDAKVTLGFDLEENHSIAWDVISKKRGFVPSIHMPKAACRLFYKIKSIRVERLQDISESDAVAEGLILQDAAGVIAYLDYENGVNYWYNNPVDSYRSLWQSINDPESWGVNPYVWVIEFEKCDKPENF